MRNFLRLLSASDLLSYNILKPTLDRLLSVVKRRYRKLLLLNRNWGTWVPLKEPIRGDRRFGPSWISRKSYPSSVWNL